MYALPLLIFHLIIVVVYTPIIFGENTRTISYVAFWTNLTAAFLQAFVLIMGIS